MKKPLAGRKAFEAMGQRARSTGMPLSFGRRMRQLWPDWAQTAWARGWLLQRYSSDEMLIKNP